MAADNGPAAAQISREEEELIRKTALVPAERRRDGLEGLVLGLDSVIITTEPGRAFAAASGLLRTTGHACMEAWADRDAEGFALGLQGSASLIVRSRGGGQNPFRDVNRAQLTGSLPDTRLETLVFETPDLGRYVRIQQGRGVRFLTTVPVEMPACSFIQTAPSRWTGNSIGIVQWKGRERSYLPAGARRAASLPQKPGLAHLRNIGVLDHAATRVRAQDRTAAILEFLSLTNYHYDFGVYVKSLNSITSVARREEGDFAMVFTSGIVPYISDEASGPTEMFIRNYGTRVHHMAFRTEQIEDTVDQLKRDGMKFLLDLVGSEEEGLRQIFSEPSEATLIVNEYIHRYGGFDGFFTRSNVEKLTEATARQ